MLQQPTTLTNAKRGNVQTATPTFLPGKFHFWNDRMYL